MSLTIQSSARLLATTACISVLAVSTICEADASVASFAISVVPVKAGAIQFDAKLVGVRPNDIVAGSPAIELVGSRNSGHRLSQHPGISVWDLRYASYVPLVDP